MLKTRFPASRRWLRRIRWRRAALCVPVALLFLHVRPAAAAPPDFVAALDAPQRAYWTELTQRAAGQRLWERRFWRLLLHYRPDAFGGGDTSEADGLGFFLAPDGKTDPRAELEATLAAFFSAATIPPAEMSPQCTFPARWRWLGEQLGFDAARLPAQPCERFAKWEAAIDAESVSLIFSSYFANNPASMFGHTLLRFNRKGRKGESFLLDSALNFAAAIPEDTGNIAYALGGVFGTFQGYFSLLPYYLKVREYSDIESRDIWEYRLSFTPSQVDYMLRHTWELGSTSFDYYFFRENCSYHLLSVLEVGRPELHLREAHRWWTLPTETVHQMMAEPGFVTDVIYRPSQGSQILQRLDAMDVAERDWVRRLIAAPEAADVPQFAALERAREALVLDAAIDYYQFHLPARPAGREAEHARLRALLLRRSRIPAASVPEMEFAPRTAPPHLGHATSRVALAGGAGRPPPAPDGTRGDDLPFAELTLQASFHDLLSDDRAFAPNSHINLLHLRGRYETEAEKWRLERFALVDVQSLVPVSIVSSQPSWRLELAWQRNREGFCADCTPFGTEIGIGYSAETNLHRREVYYAMLEASAQFDREFVTQHRAGFGLGGGIVVDLAEGWRLGLKGRRINYTQGQRGEVGELTIEQRLTLNRNTELMLQWRGVENYREASLGLGYWF